MEMEMEMDDLPETIKKFIYRMLNFPKEDIKLVSWSKKVNRWDGNSIGTLGNYMSFNKEADDCSQRISHTIGIAILNPPTFITLDFKENHVKDYANSSIWGSDTLEVRL